MITNVFGCHFMYIHTHTHTQLYIYIHIQLYVFANQKSASQSSLHVQMFQICNKHLRTLCSSMNLHYTHHNITLRV